MSIIRFFVIVKKGNIWYTIFKVNDMETIIVVEGKNDYSRIKQILPNQKIIITNGSAVSEELIIQLEKLSNQYQIILLLDPDYPGEKIRKMIANRIPNCQHIYIPKEASVSKNERKVGVEHVDLKLLKEFLKDIKIPNLNNQSDITLLDLYEMGLIGKDDSRIKRKSLGDKIGCGYSNSKQLLKKLQLFGVTKEQLLRELNK